MSKPIPRILSAMVCVVLIAACIVVATQLFSHAGLRNEIAGVYRLLDIKQQQLLKQQKEYDEAIAELPQIQAELDAIAPSAQAAYDQEQALRAQRKQLRADNAALQAEIEALKAQIASLPEHGDPQAIIGQIEAVLEILNNIPQP